jgi:hypothetical protein
MYARAVNGGFVIVQQSLARLLIRHSADSHGDPLAIAALAAAVEMALTSVGAESAIIAMAQSPRALDIDIAPSRPLTWSQRRRIATELHAATLSSRWVTATTLRIRLPVTIPSGAALLPCVPVLRRRRTTIWWLLPHVRHILLAADAHGTLAAMLAALTRMASQHSLTFALYDPAGELRSLALPQLAATPDALATARLRSLRAAWATQHQQVRENVPPLILVVVGPDELAWRDLAPLLSMPVTDGLDVHVLVLLNATIQVAEVRDACYELPVIEVHGGGAEPLPESYRPAGMAPPRLGEVLAWQSAQCTWRGTPIDTTAFAILTDEASAIITLQSAVRHMAAP